MSLFLAQVEPSSAVALAGLVVVGICLVFALWATYSAISVRRQRRRIAALEAAVDALHVELTAREGAEALFQTRIDQLVRQNADLEQFAHIASHDLRAPLRAIGNLATWIEEDCGPNISDEGRGHLSLLKGRVDRLQRLVRDLLNYSRAGRGEVDIETVDLSVLVAEVVEELDSDSLNVELNIAEGLKNGANVPNFETAKAPLRQVIANLISNSVKHHDRDHTTVAIDVAYDDDWLTLEFRDDGPGIAPEQFKRALTMFQTLKPRDELDSTGMGLALVKRLVESAGGALSLESPLDDGRGLGVKVTWPRLWGQSA